MYLIPTQIGLLVLYYLITIKNLLIIMAFNLEAFDRYGQNHTMPLRVFLMAIGVFLCTALMFYAGGVKYGITLFTEIESKGLVLGLAVGCFLVSLAGCFVAQSDNPVISFIALVMITLPLGIISGPMIASYEVIDITIAATQTVVIVGISFCFGIMFPEFFRKLGGALFMALLAVIVFQIVGMFLFPTIIMSAWFDYLIVGLFALYTAYDTYRAISVERTVDNAVDIAIDYFLDIVNIFIHLLSARD